MAFTEADKTQTPILRIVEPIFNDPKATDVQKARSIVVIQDVLWQLNPTLAHLVAYNAAANNPSLGFAPMDKLLGKEGVDKSRGLGSSGAAQAASLVVKDALLPLGLDDNTLSQVLGRLRTYVEKEMSNIIGRAA